MKYTKEFKLKCVKKYKNGERLKDPRGCKHDTFMCKVRKWSRMYDALGEAGLEHKNTTRTWEEKLALVERVVNGESITSVAYSNGIEENLLSKWYKKYREFGVDGLKLERRGRRKKMAIEPKKSNEPKTKEELEKENEYLRAENEVLKKLSALVQKRMDQRQKKK